VRPDASVIVPEIITGQRGPRCRTALDAKIAPWRERVEDRLDEQDVGAPSTSPVGLFEVGLDEGSS